MHVLLLTLSLLLFLCNSRIEAQPTKTYYVVHSGEVPVHIIPQDAQIRYPEFRDGTIFYLNGKTEARKLNYSTLYGEITYLDAKGDTLSLATNGLVKKIQIGDDQYYYLHGQGYVEVISSTASIQLARKEVLKMVVGSLPFRGYAEDNSYRGDVPTLWELYNQKSGGLMKLVKEVSYVFIDRNERFYPAKRAVLLKLFPKQKKKLDHFARANEIDFRRAEDLQKIVEFAVQNQKNTIAK
jgi:hypothetical protein